MTAFSHVSGTISERITQVRQTLPDTVRLIAVTKQVSIAAMREAYAAGIRDFAESRMQEAEAKQSQLTDLTDITWHFIGHLQRNKAQKALERFQWIHSIDNLKLAQYLHRSSANRSQKPAVLLQVKPLPDPNKYGWSEVDLWQDLPLLAECDQLNIQGLMTILPLGLTPADALAAFKQTAAIAEAINQQHLPQIQMRQLSMGMSDDYAIAVQAGATMVRLGRILFGDTVRNPAPA